VKRREFIALVGSAAAWPRAARAQQAVTPVIGFLTSYSLDASGKRLAGAFRDGLKETGYEEDRNVKIEYRSAEGDYSRLAGLAADLIARPVNVIAAVGGSPAILAAKQATSSVPIIFQTGADPVQLGIVPSLNRPGGNITGIANLSLEVAPKRIELLRELMPAAKTMALLINPASPVGNVTEGRSCPGNTIACPERQHRARVGACVCKVAFIGSKRAGDRRRPVL
jgi:putative ABC transport system substrate-binding protein